MRRLWLLVILAVLGLALRVQAGQGCFGPKCHSRGKIIKGQPHQPVASEQCDKCHFPHVSRYKYLLKAPQTEICFSCHKKIKEDISKASFVHKPVAERSCLRCHNPHSSTHKALLKKDIKNMCFSCHKDLQTKFKYSHLPFIKGRCLSCHDPHFSQDRRLIKMESNKLCFSCHKNRNKIAKIHGENINRVECLSCHQPHGSNKKGILRPISHKPYAEKNCKVCHQTKKRGVALCLQCHNKNVNSFEHFHNHLLGSYEENACLVCHNPHVGDTKDLLKDKPKYLCESCHFQVKQQRAKSLYVHPKCDQCTNCHLAHGSDHPAMLINGGNETCVRCHKTQGKFTHPVGEKVIDPRNGQPITCVTCHEPMGTNFKYNLRLSGEATLCLECHKNY